MALGAHDLGGPAHAVAVAAAHVEVVPAGGQLQALEAHPGGEAVAGLHALGTALAGPFVEDVAHAFARPAGRLVAHGEARCAVIARIMGSWSAAAHISRQECIESMGLPTSTVRSPTPAAAKGPIVEPQRRSLRCA